METVVKCEKIKEWNGKPIYKIELSNGATGESFAQEIPVGTPEDQLKFEPNSNPAYADKVKWIKPNAGGGGFKGGNRGGNESFALSYAKDLAIADKITVSDILKKADEFYNWLEAKKK